MSVRRSARAPPALPGTLCGPALALATGVAPTFGRQTGATGVARSSRATLRATAKNDGRAFLAAVEKLWSGAGDKFAELRAAIQAIRDRAANSTAYSVSLREDNDAYRSALVRLVNLTLSQQNNALWYELQTDVVALVFDTTYKEGLDHMHWVLANGADGPNRFPAMLQRFAASAQARDDAPAAAKAKGLLKRMSM